MAGSEQALRALKLGEGSRKKEYCEEEFERFRTSLLVVERSSGYKE